MIRNDLGVYKEWAGKWWSGEDRGLRTLENLVPARMQYIEKTLGSLAGRKILDVGCGGGFMSEALTRAGATVIGVDPTEPALNAARAHAQSVGLNIDYRLGTGEQLPVDTGSMDAVVCVDVLEHVNDVRQVCREIARTLRPGGVFVFDTINRNLLATVFVVYVAENVIGLLPRGTHDPDKFIKPRELDATLHDVGFRVRRMRGLGPVGISRRLDLKWGSFPTKAMMYIGHAERV